MGYVTTVRDRCKFAANAKSLLRSSRKYLRKKIANRWRWRRSERSWPRQNESDVPISAKNVPVVEIRMEKKERKEKREKRKTRKKERKRIRKNRKTRKNHQRSKRRGNHSPF